MIKLNIHAGHSLYCRGASGILDEVLENRAVKKYLLTYLDNFLDISIVDTTDDYGKTADENLAAIVNKCNKHKCDWNISIHLNAGRSDSMGDGKTGGVEVWTYTGNDLGLSTKICDKISAALNITNRGVKQSKDYYVLRKTTDKALIVECCFVDDKDDATHWNSEKCAKAIGEAITEFYALKLKEQSCSSCANYKRKE